MGKDARSAQQGFIARKFKHVPPPVQNAAPMIGGKLMTEHLAQQLTIRVFFMDAHSPYHESPTKTPMACCLQYLPKRKNLSGYTRPRKCLRRATPLEMFTQLRHQSPVAFGT